MISVCGRWRLAVGGGERWRSVEDDGGQWWSAVDGAGTRRDMVG